MTFRILGLALVGAGSYIGAMRVLIVGCGYVGTALGQELAGQGLTVFGLRRSPAGAADLRSAGIIPLSGDVTCPEDLARLLRRMAPKLRLQDASTIDHLLNRGDRR